MSIRLLPATVALAAVLLAVGAVDMWSGSDGFLGTEVSKLKSTSAKDFAAKVLSEMIVAPALAQTPPPPAAAPGNGGPGQIVFTPAELDMLQNLKSRREELDEREREIDVRTNLLAVSERRVEERIAELKQVEATINGLLVKYDEQQEAQFAAVVKIYEAMKPKDAANILNRLEMPVLIELAERIKERTMAPILSAMDPAVANTLTVELATRRALPITGGPLK